ncbi:L-lactate dehydrogenase complex protein LldG [Paenibacillus phyllosphaerae]|uniref:L-lactate dehydrogenase complex protein LldG n=1 Tax=Paenibacillus phyllosphaerae TaxID=274593 RepID=A0A7W5AYI8_9BACL|nr:LUD domain-containing protein [Paenibacillus phyllosphaerae]MBB3111125.1 L-lactate dehydrogenase complex protein LldG [Paenibacillus phyllosphaerae]
MAETHQELLQRLEAASKTRQQAFMDEIAGKLNRPRVLSKPVQPFRGAPEFWLDFNWTLEEKIEQFINNYKAAGGHAFHLSGLDEVRSFIVSKANEMSAAYIVRQDQEELASLALEEALPEASIRVWNSEEDVNWKAKAAEADFGIVRADYAAAYTGSVTVLSDKTKGRSVSLLPTVLFVLIPESRLKTRLGEILPDFDTMGRENLPAGIHFISGPSRSADIENDLTIGVHGPGVVYALIYKES